MYLLNRFCLLRQCPAQRHLHSTMYLLNLPYSEWSKAGAQKFTFHYVSIKSPYSVLAVSRYIAFTFHYVSIKSTMSGSMSITPILFTFHYVSIKS